MLLRGVYGDYLHHNDGLHLVGRIADNAIWKNHWHRIAVELASLYATPSGAVGCRFMSILPAEWLGVLRRTWNSKRPLVFDHVVLTKTVGVCRAREIR